MENLKLTSIRLSKAALAQANNLARSIGYFQTSQVIRVAIWVGLKMIKPSVFVNLSAMMWEDEEGIKHYTLEDVLRAAGVKL